MKHVTNVKHHLVKEKEIESYTHTGRYLSI